MKASELRIGNFVKKDGKDSFITMFDFQKIPISPSAAFNAEINAEPILITVPWLKKLGFKQRPQSLSFFYNKLTVFFDPFKGAWYVGGGIYVKYIHELQNAFFVITGKNLTVK